MHQLQARLVKRQQDLHRMFPSAAGGRTGLEPAVPPPLSLQHRPAALLQHTATPSHRAAHTPGKSYRSNPSSLVWSHAGPFISYQSLQLGLVTRRAVYHTKLLFHEHIYYFSKYCTYMTGQGFICRGFVMVGRLKSGAIYQTEISQKI